MEIMELTVLGVLIVCHRQAGDVGGYVAAQDQDLIGLVLIFALEWRPNGTPKSTRGKSGVIKHKVV